MKHRTLLVVVALALLAWTVPASALEGSDRYAVDGKSGTTYRVTEEVTVEIRSTLTGRKGPDQTDIRGRYGPYLIPGVATNLVAGGRGVTLDAPDVEDGMGVQDALFTAPQPKARQRVRIDYTWPGGPEGDGVTVPFTTEGYTYLCWPGQPAPSGSPRRGSTSLVIPGTHYLYHHGPDAGKVGHEILGLEKTTASLRGKVAFARPGVCTEVIDGRMVVVGEAGTESSPLRTFAWPADPEWSAFIAEAATDALPALEAFFGSPQPIFALGFREAADVVYPYSAGDLEPQLRTFAVTASTREPAEVATRLARAWVATESSPITDIWLREGIARYAGHAAVGQGCPEPVSSEVDLLGAMTDPTDSRDPEAWMAWDTASDMACGVVERRAQAIGHEALGAIVAEFVTSESPVTTQDWIDLLGTAVKGADDGA